MTPERSSPTSISISTRAGFGAPAKALSIISAWGMESRPKEMSTVFASSRIRASLDSPTISLAMKISRSPASAMTSASPTLATVTPLAPSSS